MNRSRIQSGDEANIFINVKYVYTPNLKHDITFMEQ